jgi:hypothetical protein
MKSFSREEILDILSVLYWDLNIPTEEIYRYLYEENRDGHPLLDKTNLYRRMLTTLDWYTILKLIPPEKLRFLLDEKVIQQIFPKDLQKKYQYVRTILCK